MTGIRQISAPPGRANKPNKIVGTIAGIRRQGQSAMRSIIVLLVLLTLGFNQPALANVYRYERNGQVLEIKLHGNFPEAGDSGVITWIESTADALARVYGRWPRDYWQVRVQPIPSRGSDPVPWAQVNRGDPDVVSFYIDANASHDKLVNNWTAYHEFSHLLIPYRGWGDMWFSEGLASYYQNLLQARHGIFDEREMWQRLYDGFMRGRKNRRPDLSLGELSDRMREERSFMRVYWSGAWYFLAADAELRRRSGGRKSLDTALQQLNICCREQILSARQIASRLDTLSGESVFLPLFNEVSDSRALPEFETLYRELGISVHRGRVSLDEDHAKAALRRGFAG